MDEMRAKLNDAIASCSDLSKALRAMSAENKELRGKVAKLEQREETLTCQLLQEIDRQG
jgi:hypothetical protein